MKFAAYIQATKDDFCLFEVCQRMFEEGLTTFFFIIPDEYWSGAVTPESDKDQVVDVARRVAQLGAETHIHHQEVGKHRQDGRSRIQVETFFRNESLAHIREAGFEHIIIIDGDELWCRGYYRQLTDFVRQHKPDAVSFKMIPTIGMPGLPIEGATDGATVYVSPTTLFRECRGPHGDNVIVETIRPIIHFTATRKTVQEIIDKHRASGHYDDPNYDFEGWIQNTLPNVRPGSTNVHMHVPWNPWPLVREWKASELKEIPTSLHPYLDLRRVVND